MQQSSNLAVLELLRGTNHKRLLNADNKLRVAGGELGGGMG